MLEQVWSFFVKHWRDGMEILVLAVVFYWAYRSFRSTRGAKLVVSMVVGLVLTTTLAQILELEVVGWLVRAAGLFLALTLVVIFQPELRRAMADLGNYRFFAPRAQKAEFVERLDEVVRKLAAKRYGALLAIERRSDLASFLETGVEIDGEFSAELLLTIFHPKTALHDGGVILRQDTIVGAACVFPVTQREMADRSIGLRHRAGIGLTEETDAIVVVVSEETGHVSVCHRGEIERDLDSEEFQERLEELLILKAEKEDDDEHPRERRDGSATTKLES